MKSHKHIYLIAELLILLIAITGCSLNNVDNMEGRTSSKEDLMAAKQILSTSIASDQSGIILSLNDAFSSVTENGFIIAPYQGDHSGRGNEINYQHAYQQKSGVHVVSFKRKVEDALFSKTVTGDLRYRYLTTNGTTIEFPQKNARRISSIYYDGRNEGKITTLHKKVYFVRQDTFLISGLTSPAVTIDGVHHGNGTIKITPANGSSFKRPYNLEINLLNITAPSSAFNNNQNFWKKVSGTLSWQLQIGNSSNAKNMGGTIKLGGAGMARLKFNRSHKTYQINLNNGDLKDPDNEFEGRITAVDLTTQRITLFNGRTLYLTQKTQIDEDEYASLKAVRKAVNNGIKVWTEGSGSKKGEQFIVTEIEFEKEEREQDDETENQVEFDDIVSSVNAEAGTFTLFGKVTIAVDETTNISEEGDYMNLQEVARALSSGHQITAEGEAVTQNGSGPADLTAIEVEFEKEEQNNGEED